jgi:hypothetical protein
MTDLIQRMVEAGARVMWSRWHMKDVEYWSSGDGSIIDEPTREYYRNEARACLTAALAAAEGDGVVPVKVPEPLAPAGDAAGQYMLGAVAGYNNCRAATLATKVTP